MRNVCNKIKNTTHLENAIGMQVFRLLTLSLSLAFKWVYFSFHFANAFHSFVSYCFRLETIVHRFYFIIVFISVHYESFAFFFLFIQLLQWYKYSRAYRCAFFFARSLSLSLKMLCIAVFNKSACNRETNICVLHVMDTNFNLFFFVTPSFVILLRLNRIFVVIFVSIIIIVRNGMCADLFFVLFFCFFKFIQLQNHSATLIIDKLKIYWYNYNCLNKYTDHTIDNTGLVWKLKTWLLNFMAVIFTKRFFILISRGNIFFFGFFLVVCEKNVSFFRSEHYVNDVRYVTLGVNIFSCSTHTYTHTKNGRKIEIE